MIKMNLLILFPFLNEIYYTITILNTTNHYLTFTHIDLQWAL